MNRYKKNKRRSEHPPVTIINMQSWEFDCAACGNSSDDDYAIPFWNGEPCSNERPYHEIDGYRSVCKSCWNNWEKKYIYKTGEK